MPGILQDPRLAHRANLGQRAATLWARQQAQGNKAVQRMLAPFDSTIPLGVAPKLTVSRPGDRYEQEADRVAETVLRMPEPQVRRQVEEEEEPIQAKALAEQITPLVQRQEEEEETLQARLASAERVQRQDEKVDPEEERKALEEIQASGQAVKITSALENRARALRGGGQPLPASTRSFFEPRFGTSFSQVRIHSGGEAAGTARAMKAEAFTLGRDIVFGDGKYDPNSTAGKKLLAHELTHVVQQGGTRNVQRLSLDRDAIIQRVTRYDFSGTTFTVSGVSLTDRQIRSAIRYYAWWDRKRKRRRLKRRWRKAKRTRFMLARTLGLDLDFSWTSPETIRLIANWQKTRGLYPNGKLGRRSRQELSKESHKQARERILTWRPHRMGGPRTGVKPSLLVKVDNICGRMKAQGYPTIIRYGRRTMRQQVWIATAGRTYAQFKRFMYREVRRGHISKAEAKKWLKYYHPRTGQRRLRGGKTKGTWTLASKHLKGQAVDIVHPKKLWEPLEGNRYWNALEEAAEAEGLRIGPPGDDLAHVQER